jgi:hypothetical protein
VRPWHLSVLRLMGPTHEFRGVKRWATGRCIQLNIHGIEDSTRGKFEFIFTPENPFIGKVTVKTSDPYELVAEWREGCEPPCDVDYGNQDPLPIDEDCVPLESDGPNEENTV